MDQFTNQIVTDIATGILANFSTDVCKQFFETVFKLKPSLEKKLQNAKTTQELNNIFSEAVGIIDVNANTGNINVHGGILNALRDIRFNHSNGMVNITGAEIYAPVIFTGGNQGATGTTLIGKKTFLKSQGTSISLGDGGSITMSGGSSITQT